MRTTCPYYGVGCQLLLHVDRPGNQVVRVTGVEGVPPNDGTLCVKGRFGYEFAASPLRLRQPLLRKNGRLEPVSWEEALDHTADRLRAIRDVHGPDAVSGVAYSRDTSENCYAAQKSLRAAVGTNSVDNCART